MYEHILLIDDEPHFRYSAELALKKRGYRTSEADDGKDALDRILAAEKNQPAIDLIVLDMNLPTLSGVEIMRRLHDMRISVPVIVVSGGLNAELYKELLSLGCLEIFFKPINEQLFLDKIDEIVRGE